VAAVREAGSKAGDNTYTASVDYRHPGLFRVGERQIKIEMRQIARFLVKLSAAMSFEHYDKLTKAVYLGNMQAERNGYAIAEDRPKNAPRPSVSPTSQWA